MQAGRTASTKALRAHGASVAEVQVMGLGRKMRPRSSVAL
jgi:hypothetical protein